MSWDILDKYIYMNRRSIFHSPEDEGVMLRGR